MSDALSGRELVADLQAPVATITLQRPAKLNAITPAMLAELEHALDEVEASDEIRVVVVTGAGERAFSAGADIEAWSSLRPSSIQNS